MSYKFLTDLLKCQSCNNPLEDAKILPCGIFCIYCVSNLVKNANESTREFLCNSCHEIHHIPVNDFSNWKALKEIKSALNLNRNLNQLEKSLNTFEFQLKNSIDLIKEHCLGLRNETNSEAEAAIKQIQVARDESLEEINLYEARCISNLESNNLIKQEFETIMIESNQFHSKWQKYLKDNQLDEMEMDKAYKETWNFRNKVNNGLLGFEWFLFEKKKNRKYFSINIDSSILKIDKYNEFENDEVFLKRILDNFYLQWGLDFNQFDLKSFETGKFAIVYQDGLDMVNVAIFDSNLNICKSTQTSFCSNVKINIKLKVDNGLLIFSCNHLKKFKLVLMNSNLEIIKSITIPNKILSLDANETNIYCLTSGKTLMIFDHELKLVESVDQTGYNKGIKQISFKNNKFYSLFKDKINIMDKDGDSVIVIKTNGDKMVFDSQSNLLVLSLVKDNKIFKYDSNGNLKEEISTRFGGASMFDIFLNEKDKIFSIDKMNGRIFLEIGKN